MKEIDQISTEEITSIYNLINLIPIINPDIGIKTMEGMEKMLDYRIEDTIEIDSCHMVREGYNLCYGNCIPDKADTILNALNPLKSFCIYRLKNMGVKALYPFSRKNNKWIIREDILQVTLNNLNVIFDSYYELRALFNQFADLMYSFSNLMPAPMGYNAYTDLHGNHVFGKGSYKENNDYPYFYMKNLENGNDDKMLIWLNDNMEKYHLKEIFDLHPPFSKPNEYYDDDKYDALREYVNNAIIVIENRGKWLRDNRNNMKERND